MKWSVIICTHNRSKDLKETLAAVSLIIDSPENLEILVVDNASQDDTKEVVSEMMAQLSNLKYFREERVGLSHARNTGIEHARGKFVAFLDDDALPRPDWLAKLESCFVDSRVACVGGMVKPVWNNLPGWPDWLHPRLIGYFTVVDYPEFRKLGYPSCPAGTNVAFRKSIFEEVGHFDPRLGRTGASLLSGEEVDLCVAIEQAGYQIVYNPEAIVHHKVHENRLTQKWVLERSHWGGASSALMERRRFGVVNYLLKSIKYLLLITLSSILKRVFALLNNGKKMFFWQCQELFSRAFLKALWHGHSPMNDKDKI